MHISIHAPRVGSDAALRCADSSSKRISIHAPRVGSDVCNRSVINMTKYFNPRSPCGERHCPALATFDSICISIHAPRVGSDWNFFKIFVEAFYFNPRSPCGERQDVVQSVPPSRQFQSTLPVWGATLCSWSCARFCGIFQSTLPVWGATPRVRWTMGFALDFNPRSPCGERLD